MRIKCIPLVMFVLFSTALCGQSKNPVWEINHMKVKDSTELNSYVEFLKLNYGATREEGIRQSMVVSYKILVKQKELRKIDWDVLLMTEYKDTAQMHAFFNAYPTITKKLFPGVGAKKVNGKSWTDFGEGKLYMVLKEEDQLK